MLFWDGKEKILDYKTKADFHGQERLKEIILELLNKYTRNIDERSDMIYTDYGNFKRLSYGLVSNGDGVEECRQCPDKAYTDYSRGSVITTTIMYKTPFTLAFSAGMFDKSELSWLSSLDETQKYYINSIRFERYREDLRKLIGNLNLEQLKKVMDVISLVGDKDVIDAFLNICSPDFAAFNNVLSFVEFQEENSCSVSSVKDKYVDIAKSNTEITRALRLPIKGVK